MSNDPERDARIPLSVGTRGAGASLQSPGGEPLTNSLMRQIAALDPSAREQLANWTVQFAGPVAHSPLAQEKASGVRWPPTTPIGTPGIALHNVDEAFRLEVLDDRDVLVADALIAAAKVILRNVPDCADRSQAMRDLRTARWATHSAIGNHGRF